MGFSLGLGVYLAFSERAEGFARRKLDERLERGREDAARQGERFGEASEPRPEGLVVWFHAASVGESLSILELVRRVGDRRADVSFLITTGTVTSARMVAARLPERAIHQYVPVDVRPFIRRFLGHWRPDLAVWTESELWPALMHETAITGVPMLLINARISAATHRRWRWFPGVSRSLLRRFGHALIQDETTARYLRRLGLPRGRGEVAGTLKEGSAALPHDEAERQRFAAKLDGRPVWLAASTHEGEELMAAEAHRRARRSSQRLLLIIAPRHPERGPAIAARLADDGWRVGLRSAGDVPDAACDVYIADTLGEMGLWYRLSPVSFLGGSLAEIGGHNPFEPAALGSAILHGPHVHKVADIYERLSAAGAALEVGSAADLGEKVVEVLAPDRAAAMAHAAWEVSSSGAEVTDRALALLLHHLPAAPEDGAA